ncbi:MAG: ATP-binding protein, partial [Actinomycetales bacterium]
MVEKPPRVFDRDVEWARLSAFVTRRAGRPEFAVVSGRRRQGKTFLLEALARATGGVYFGATEATSEESLRLLGESLADASGSTLPLRFAAWDEAVRHLVETSARVPGPVVVDEFPYLIRADPSIPSILQRELDRAVTEGREVSLVVCGSAMSVMGELLAGAAPLRGRATMELVIRPFGPRTARDYWGITDPGLAVRVHAVVGGTPAYRRFVGDDTPSDPADFDPWVIRSVLDPASPLFREARYLLAEEAGVRDTPMYSSILAAVADGNATRGGIASYIGRRAADIGHHLAVLEDSGLVRRQPDAFRAGRSTYHVAEPIVAFYHSVMRPRWA